MGNEIVIKANGVKKKYDDSLALDGIDLEVISGQILGFIDLMAQASRLFYSLYSALLTPKGI